jgi:hypothetical protein
MTGESFASICHKSAAGAYTDKVDLTKLPAIKGGEMYRDGGVAPLEVQKDGRQRSIARVEAFAKRRADVIAALDAAMPNRKIVEKDITNADPAKSCTNKPTQKALSRELSDMLGRFTALYHDGTIPESTQSIARTTNTFKAAPDAQAAYARLDARSGYRPADIALGVVRPAMGYPKLRDLANATLRLLSSDADPYALVFQRDADGRRIPVPGAAYGQFSKLLEVTHEELRDITADPVVSPLQLPAAMQDLSGRWVIVRPRTNLEAIGEILYLSDASFASSGALPAPRYIVRRDSRGYAKVRLVDGKVPSPFLDSNSLGVADIDDLGRFLRTDSSTAPSPFLTMWQSSSGRDDATRPIVGTDLVYDYLDTSTLFANAALDNLPPLLDVSGGRETLMDALAGAYVLFGNRNATATRSYSNDPNRKADWAIVHPGVAPPAGVEKVAVSYNGFLPETSPLLDAVYAAGQILGDPSADDVLALVATLLRSYQSDLARVAGDALVAKASADNHPEAKLPATSLFWDDLLVVVDKIATKPGLLEALMKSLADDRSLLLGQVFANYINFRDQISYDRGSLNTLRNVTTGVAAQPMKTLVDRTKPATGFNKSGFQRFLAAIHDTNNTAACNREGAKVHAKLGILNITLPLFGGTYKECEVFKLDNVARFYVQAIVGRGELKFREGFLNTLAQFGLANAKLIEDSSGITGFWGTDLRPKPAWLNRLVFFGMNETTSQALNGGATYLFLKDLIGQDLGNNQWVTGVGSSTCPERVITDPVPTASDVSPDGKVHGLRTCAAGQYVFDRDRDATFVWENFGFFDGATPMVTAFADNQSEDLFTETMEVLHKYWGNADLTDSECILRSTKTGSQVVTTESCVRDGLVTYEPFLAEFFSSDTWKALGSLMKTLNGVTVAHCTATDPTTKACTKVENRPAISVLAEATRTLVMQMRASNVVNADGSTGLRDRAGTITGLRNDGSTTPQVTPIYLLLQALNGMDSQFNAYAAANPQDAQRQTQWKSARSRLVDQFLDVTGKGTPTASFVNTAIIKIAPVIVEVLRSQLAANCEKSFGTTAPERCAWARDTMTKKVSDVVGGPTFAAVVDLLDAIRKDEPARTQTEDLANYLLDPTSDNDARTTVLAAMTDAVQVMGDDTNLVPLLKGLADVASASLVDSSGRVVRKSVVDANLALLSRIAGRAFLKGGTAEDCSREVDPNEAMMLVLGKLVTPTQLPSGRQTPLEAIMDAIAEVNRVNSTVTATPAKLTGADYANIADNIGDFLASKERGLEQFYEIVRQGTASE